MRKENREDEQENQKEERNPGDKQKRKNRKKKKKGKEKRKAAQERKLVQACNAEESSEIPMTEKPKRFFMGGDMKGERSGNNGSSKWEGKHKVLVRTREHKLKYFVVDLRKDIIEMQNPYKLWGDCFLGSAVVFREEEDKMIVYEFGGVEEDTFNNFKETKDDDHIILHSFSGTSKSILNLKTNPPTWSKWEDCRAKTPRYYRMMSCTATLGNKIFSFGGITQVGEVYDTSKNSPEWEDTTFPFLETPAADFNTGELPSRCPIVSHPVLSDPKNNRLILYFEDHSRLYAYYPDNDKESQWECLDNDLKTLPCWNQLLVDDVIYFFDSPYTILAYDITQRKWLDVSWPQKKLRDCDMFFTDMTKMIHLGDGIMCLAISYPPYAVFGPLLQFLRLRVSRVDDDNVQLTPISYHKFNTHSGRGWIFTPF